MKEIAGSILILAGTISLVAANQFNSLFFWIVGTLMLLDGYFILTVSMFFPEWLKNLFAKTNSISKNTNVKMS